MPPAARITDLQLCPTAKAVAPVINGASTVLIEGLGAARSGDAIACLDGPTKIDTHCNSVIIESAASARMADTTCHGGAITSGALTVLIGSGGSSTGGTQATARTVAAPFVSFR